MEAPNIVPPQENDAGTAVILDFGLGFVHRFVPTFF